MFGKLLQVAVSEARNIRLPDERFSAFINYMLSGYACLFIAMGIILNRTIYFSTVRRPVHVNMFARITMTIASLGYFITSILPSLKAIYAHPESPRVSENALWDLFKAICLSHFVDSFLSNLQGRSISAPFGLTLFEYSLSFQEFDGVQKPSPELLFLCSLTCVSYLLNHLIELFGLRRYRLIPSSIIGITFLVGFGISLFKGRILNFPTVCIIGVLPQFIISLIVLVCVSVHLLAHLVIDDPSSLRGSLKAVHASLEDDFYRFLMKTGSLSLAMISSTGLNNELPPIPVPEMTWQEKNFTTLASQKRNFNTTGYAREWKHPILSNDGKPSCGPYQYQNDNSIITTVNRIKLANELVKSFFLSLKSYFRNPVSDVREDVKNADVVETFDMLETADADYRRLLTGKLLPENDMSGDYQESNSDDSEDDWQDEDNENPYELSYLDLGPLDSLIVPKTQEDRDFARVVRAHLTSTSVVTRSRMAASGLTEEDTLQNFILHRRQQNGSEDGDAEQSSICVVCHGNKREIIFWPCRCFSICEDCRLSLSMRNFKTCVCCRQKVDAFSRVYIP